MYQNKSPLISIIVPVYQAAKTIIECVESIQKQTYEHLEIILIDDGSTDGSDSLCDQIALEDNRIVVIHQQNFGVSAARNAGLALATGEYIGFVDSDDTAEPAMFEKLLKAAQKYGKQIAVCGHYRHHIDGSLEIRDNSEMRTCLTVLESLPYLLSDRYFEGFLWNKLFDSQLFFDNNPLLFDRNIFFCEDLILVSQYLLKTMNKTDGIVCIPEALYHYRLRESGAMYSFDSKRLTEINAWRQLMDMWGTYSSDALHQLQIRCMEAALNIWRMAKIKGNKDSKEYLTFLRDEINKYRIRYFLSKNVPSRRKVRCIIITLFPKLSFKLWKQLRAKLKRLRCSV